MGNLEDLKTLDYHAARGAKCLHAHVFVMETPHAREKREELTFNPSSLIPTANSITWKPPSSDSEVIPEPQKQMLTTTAHFVTYLLHIVQKSQLLTTIKLPAGSWDRQLTALWTGAVYPAVFCHHKLVFWVLSSKISFACSWTPYKWNHTNTHFCVSGFFCSK